MSLVIRPATEDDRERILWVEAQAFNLAPGSRQRYSDRMDISQFRVAELDGTIGAALRLVPSGHWFGGREVPQTGVSAVAVAADARGKRLAETLVLESLKETRTPISSLWPATVPLYRRCGYEYAAMRTCWRAPLRQLPRSAAIEAEPWTDDDLDAVDACHRAMSAPHNGPIARPPAWWKTFINTPRGEGELYRVCVRQDGRITGAAVYGQAAHKDEAWQYNLVCNTLAWITPEAIGSLLTYFGRHRSLGKDLVWFGPPADPLVTLFDEQDIDVDHNFRLMLRLLDVPAAIEARGYAPDVDAAVELTVHDDTLPGNAGAWRIEVSGGAAKVAPATTTTATLHARTLASIYSGMLSAADARRIGALDADARAIAALDEIFAGPAPWTEEMF